MLLGIMKQVIVSLCFIASSIGVSAQSRKIENVILVTTDGFRWQEVFNGMDSSLANNPKFNQKDSAFIFKKYWAGTPEQRREKLMPFLWSTIAKQGQI